MINAAGISVNNTGVVVDASLVVDSGDPVDVGTFTVDDGRWVVPAGGLVGELSVGVVPCAGAAELCGRDAVEDAENCNYPKSQKAMIMKSYLHKR